MIRRFSFARAYAPVALLIAIVLIAAGAVFSLVVWHNWSAHSATLARAERNVTDLTRSLAQHSSRTIDEADLLISEIVERVENGALSTYQIDRLNRHLANRVAAVPQVREIGVLSASGDWLASSLKDLPIHNNGDRDYFRFHKDNESRSFRINTPIKSRLTGQWTILVTRRVNDSVGAFAGIVSAAIDVGYFQRFYETFNIGERGSITLWLDDGSILVRHPFDDANLSKDGSKIPFFRDGRAKTSSGLFRSASAFDGLTKLVGFHHSEEFPMVTVLAIEEKEILASWRREGMVDAAVAAFMLGLIGIFGVGAIKQLRRRLQIEARYRLLAENAGDIVVVVNFDGVRQYVSPSVIDVLGYSVDEFLATTAYETANPTHHRFLRATFQLMKDGSEGQRLEHQMKRKDGEYVWVETHFRRFDQNGDNTACIIAVVRDISNRKAMEIELQAANARLKAMATTDFLTGIANRRGFDSAIDKEHRRCVRAGAALSVLFIDIDAFKGYNDYFGHSKGDECVRQVAQALHRSMKRVEDLVARYGGEEFAVILPETDEVEATQIAEDVRRDVELLKIHNPKSQFGRVTISIGVASMATDPGQSAEKLLLHADCALYAAKGKGRNMVVAWSQMTPDRKLASA